MSYDFYQYAVEFFTIDPEPDPTPAPVIYTPPPPFHYYPPIEKLHELF